MSNDFPRLSWINKFYNIMLFFFFFDVKFSIKVCVFDEIMYFFHCQNLLG